MMVVVVVRSMVVHVVPGRRRPGSGGGRLQPHGIDGPNDVTAPVGVSGGGPRGGGGPGPPGGLVAPHGADAGRLAATSGAGEELWGEPRTDWWPASARRESREPGAGSPRWWLNANEPANEPVNRGRDSACSRAGGSVLITRSSYLFLGGNASVLVLALKNKICGCLVDGMLGL